MKKANSDSTIMTLNGMLLQVEKYSFAYIPDKSRQLEAAYCNKG